MPDAVVDRISGQDGCVGIPDPKCELAAGQSRSEIIVDQGDIPVNQPGALPPLSRAASLGGLDPEYDAEIIADKVADLDITIDAVKIQTTIDLTIGAPGRASHRPVIGISRRIYGGRSIRRIQRPITCAISGNGQQVCHQFFLAMPTSMFC